MKPEELEPIPTILWSGEAVKILDQRQLPRRELYLTIETPRALIGAIRSLAIRGAPALGIAGAYGAALAAARACRDGRDPRSAVKAAASKIAGARPTAVNLAYGVDRALAEVKRHFEKGGRGDDLPRTLSDVGDKLLAEDLESSRRMAQYGAELIHEGSTVLTHCNTGGLATGGLGTALAVIRLAAARGTIHEVLVDETRPLLQGGRLTLWELNRYQIPARLLCDGAAAWAMRRLSVAGVLVGADRVAKNGDTANKVGTLGLALAAKASAIPFYVVAPRTSFDPETPDGASIEIEERDPSEVLSASGWKKSCGACAFNPAFDVTPADLITAWITDRGVERPPFQN